MEDTRFSNVLAELNAKQTSFSRANLALWVGGVITLFALILGGFNGLLLGLVAMGILAAAGAWLDSFKRVSVIMYDLEEEASSAYEAATKAFDTLARCSAKWHVYAGGTVRDIHTWKRNAGASHLVDKRPTIFDYHLPRLLKSNVTPPAIKSGKEILYFLPDFLLVVDSNKIGAVAYDTLIVRWEDSPFIENGSVPSDAQVIQHTWKHPNKSGGPDRRFADNYQIPVCLYESIYLTSSNGLNELLVVSRSGVTGPFAQAVMALAKANGTTASAVVVPRLGGREVSVG